MQCQTVNFEVLAFISFGELSQKIVLGLEQFQEKKGIMQYASVPEMVYVQEPVYAVDQPCPQCECRDTFPIMNMLSSTRQCGRCGHAFPPRVLGYRRVRVEKKRGV